MIDDAKLRDELAQIPSEYQEIFRATIETEVRQAALADDQEVLRYLRRRQEEFRRGAFIRPDGRTGVITMGPDGKYEQTIEAMTRGGDSEAAAGERRLTLLKAAGFVLLCVVLILFAFSGREGNRPEAAARLSSATAVADANPAAPPTPTLEPLPDAGNFETLRAVGGSGGGLSLGRPASLELHYQAGERVLALAIDPSQVTPRGELKYQEEIMLSENPLAVWVFGTVLNYAIGLPDSAVRSLQPGDRIVLNTDTGASLRFIVARTGDWPNYATGALFSQDRIGMTLFALPAVSETAVAVAMANYDISQESVTTAPAYEIGDAVSVGSMQATVAGLTVDHTLDGRLQVIVNGRASGATSAGALMLSLASSREQTEAIELRPAGAEGAWSAQFSLPAGVQGHPLLAEFRVFPSGDVELVHLGDAPVLMDALDVDRIESAWQVERGEAIVHLAIANRGGGAVRLGPDYFQASIRGGDLSLIVTPNLPILIPAGETVAVDVSFVPAVLQQNVHLRIGSDLWELSGFPIR
jgi:hypothetical protein